MNFPLLERLARLRGLVAGPGGAPGPSPGPAAPPRQAAAPPVDLLVTHCEVVERHGTGVLLRRLFGGGAPVATVRSRDMYGGEPGLGAVQVKLAHQGAPWPEVVAGVVAALGHLRVRRILCVPFFPDEALTALAARDAFGAPLCTWIMDDQNIEADGIADELLRRLFDRSALLLAISPELRQAYQAKFGRRFALAPPAVSPRFLLRAPAAPEPGLVDRRHGLLFGNVWGERWLDDLLGVLPGSGVTLDWHSGGGTPWRRDDARALEAAGLAVRPHLPEPELVAALRAAPFVVVPTGTLQGGDEHRFLARLSLPSRLPYVAATAGTPVLVLGHPESAAARFVARHGLGLVAPYRRAAFGEAVEALCRPEAQARHRAAAAALAPALSAEGMAGWIWRSLEAGGPVDGRFAPLERSA